MVIPSFLYSALDAETLRMADELASLGGGDARAVNMEVHCVVDDRLTRLDNQTIWLNEGSISIRDALQPLDTPVAECMKNYTFTGSHSLHDVLQCPSHTFGPSKSLSDWVREGFNACLIAYGERSAGKTATLFGFDVTATANKVTNLSRDGGFGGMDRKGQLSEGGIALGVLRELFYSSKRQLGPRNERMTNSYERGKITIALSAWILRGQLIVDLLTSVTKIDAVAMEFALVECSTYDVAVQVLETARIRAKTAHRPGDHLSERDRAHFFLRILVHRTDLEGGSVLSHIHLVDLIGTSSTEISAFRKMEEHDRICKRDTAVQLQSLSQVLLEMRSSSEKHKPPAHGIAPKSDPKSDPTQPPYASTAELLASLSPVIQVTSARASKLTCMLAPILQGNCRTLFLAFLRDGESHSKQTAHTIQALKGVPSIVSACHRIKGVPLDALTCSFKHPDTVLSPLRSSRELIWGRAGGGEVERDDDVTLPYAQNTQLSFRSSSLPTLRESFPPPSYSPHSNTHTQSRSMISQNSSHPREMSPKASSSPPRLRAGPDRKALHPMWKNAPPSYPDTAHTRDISREKDGGKDRKGAKVRGIGAEGGRDMERVEEVRSSTSTSGLDDLCQEFHMLMTQLEGGSVDSSTKSHAHPTHQQQQLSRPDRKDTMKTRDTGSDYADSTHRPPHTDTEDTDDVTLLSAIRSMARLHRERDRGKGQGPSQSHPSQVGVLQNRISAEIHSMQALGGSKEGKGDRDRGGPSSDPKGPRGPRHLVESLPLEDGGHGVIEEEEEEEEEGGYYRTTSPSASPPRAQRMRPSSAPGYHSTPHSDPYGTVTAQDTPSVGWRALHSTGTSPPPKQPPRIPLGASDSMYGKEGKKDLRRGMGGEGCGGSTPSGRGRYGNESMHSSGQTPSPPLSSALHDLSLMTERSEGMRGIEAIGGSKGIDRNIRRGGRGGGKGDECLGSEDSFDPHNSSTGNLVESGGDGVGGGHFWDDVKVSGGGRYRREDGENSSESILLSAQSSSDSPSSSHLSTSSSSSSDGEEKDGPLSRGKRRAFSSGMWRRKGEDTEQEEEEGEEEEGEEKGYSAGEYEGGRNDEEEDQEWEEEEGECPAPLSFTRQSSEGHMIEKERDRERGGVDHAQRGSKGGDSYQAKYKAMMEAADIQEREDRERRDEIDRREARERRNEREKGEEREKVKPKERGSDDDEGSSVSDDSLTSVPALLARRDEKVYRESKSDRERLDGVKSKIGGKEDRTEDNRKGRTLRKKYEEQATGGKKKKSDRLKSRSGKGRRGDRRGYEDDEDQDEDEDQTSKGREDRTDHIWALDFVERSMKGDEKQRLLGEEDLGHVTKRSLFQALQEERNMRFRMSSRMQTNKEEAELQQAQYELDALEQKKEVRQLKTQVRCLSSQEPLFEIYKTFEEQMQRLIVESEALRGRNLILESEALNAMHVPGTLGGSFQGVGTSSGSFQGTSWRDREVDVSGDRHTERAADRGSFGLSDSRTVDLDSTRGVPHKLLLKFKRLIQEKEAFRQALEVMYGRERQYVLSEKILQDSSKRLKAAHLEACRLRKELEVERSAGVSALRDLDLIREDSKGLREAEKELRGNRSELLGELSQLRERVRELEQDRNPHTAVPYNRPDPHRSPPRLPFSSDPPSSSASPSATSLGPNSSVHLARVSAGRGAGVTYRSDVSFTNYDNNFTSGESAHSSSAHNQSSVGVGGGAGRSGSATRRLPWEKVPMAHGSSVPKSVRAEESVLEGALSTLHSGLISSCPSLLPSFRDLYDEIHREKERGVQQRAALLGLGSGPGLGGFQPSQQHCVQQGHGQGQEQGRQSVGGMGKRQLALRSPPNDSSASTSTLSRSRGLSDASGSQRDRTALGGNKASGGVGVGLVHQQWQI